MNSRVIETLLNDLPADRTQALYDICDRIRRDGEFGGFAGSERLVVFDLLTKFIIRFGFDNIEIPIPKNANSSSEINIAIDSIIDQVERSRAAESLDKALESFKDRLDGDEFGVAVLSGDEKELLRHKLQEIKNIINSSELDDRKKGALLSRLQALETEIELERTPTERFFGFMIDLAFVSGEMAKQAKPAIDEFKEILKIVMRSRAKNEGVELPSRDNLPQLPSVDDE